MPDRPSMDNYIDVAERLQDFEDFTKGKGSLQRVGEPSVMTVTGINKKTKQEETGTFIVYTAAAYRHDADPRPGIGTAWEPFPGITPYTNGSELMNAETAAWGRAIVACGLPAGRHLASRQEVRARVEDQAAIADAEAKGEKPPTPRPAKPEPKIPADLVAVIAREYAAAGWKDPDAEDPHVVLRATLLSVGAAQTNGEIVECIRSLTEPQATLLRKELAKPSEKS